MFMSDLHQGRIQDLLMCMVDSVFIVIIHIDIIQRSCWHEIEAEYLGCLDVAAHRAIKQVFVRDEHIE